MPKRGKRRLVHSANTGSKYIRKECRYALIKRSQYDAALALFRMAHGRMPTLSETVNYALRLFMRQDRVENEMERHWRRERPRREERLRSKGYLVKIAATPFGRALRYAKVRRRK